MIKYYCYKCKEELNIKEAVSCCVDICLRERIRKLLCAKCIELLKNWLSEYNK